MTDELLYTKIARHIADTGSPAAGPSRRARRLPRRRLLDPARAVLRSLDPVDRLRRRARRSTPCCSRAPRSRSTCSRGESCRPSARWSSPASIAIPWAVNTATVMSESAAYPVFAGPYSPATARSRGRRRDVTRRRSAAAARAPHPAPVPRPRGRVRERRARRRRARQRSGGPRAGGGVRRRSGGGVPAAGARGGYRLLGDYGVTATEGWLFGRRLEGGDDPPRRRRGRARRGSRSCSGVVDAHEPPRGPGRGASLRDFSWGRPAAARARDRLLRPLLRRRGGDPRPRLF